MKTLVIGARWVTSWESEAIRQRGLDYLKTMFFDARKAEANEDIFVQDVINELRKHDDLRIVFVTHNLSLIRRISIAMGEMKYKYKPLILMQNSNYSKPNKHRYYLL